MKYTVEIGVWKFQFDDGTTATNFAELAVAHYVPTDYNKKLEPSITIGKGEDDDEGRSEAKDNRPD